MRKEAVDGDRLFVIDECLDGVECREHIARSEGEGYGDATITTVARRDAEAGDPQQRQAHRR